MIQDFINNNRRNQSVLKVHLLTVCSSHKGRFFWIRYCSKYAFVVEVPSNFLQKSQSVNLHDKEGGKYEAL